MRRVVLVFAVVVASLVGATLSRAATATPTGQPLYQFVDSGTGPLPWNAASLEGSLGGATMLGGPHSAANAVEGALAFRTTQSDVALYTQPVSGQATFTDLSSLGAAPAPAADPVPFFDPSGNVDAIYVDAIGELVILCANDPMTAYWPHLHHMSTWLAETSVNLSALSGVTFANGLASVQVNGSSATVAARTSTNAIEVLSLAWDPGSAVPYLSAAVNASVLTNATTATSDPVVLDTTVPEVVATALSGDLELFAETGPADAPWVLTDLSKVTTGPKVTGPLAVAGTSDQAFVAALGPNGATILFRAPVGVAAPVTTTSVATTTTTTTPGVATGVTTGVDGPWGFSNLTTNTPGAPPLSGALFLSATDAQIVVAGQAADWGDLFALSDTGVGGAWVATDVSVTAGSAARTVGSVVTGFAAGPALDLFAAGIASPPPQGVGVYAIPSAKWTQAVSDGWPILSETGGLGTTSAPWVGFTSAASAATSPDFLMGQSIYDAHKRVTWLSFWTVSGPEKGEAKKAATYYSHGFAAGVWVATQIDQYRGLGVGLKPDWVIFDPEGYPDNHSGLDAPGGASAATMATYATYWSSMLSGWAQGLDSVDPSLNAAVYANQSEYRNYQLSTSPLPVFEAVAFSNGGPVPVAGASGSNVRGFIAFSAVCSPSTALQSEETTLVDPPWGGQFNTLQFNAGVYCAPAPA